MSEEAEHAVTFTGQNQYDLLRQIKEFIKEKEGLQELFEIRKDDNSGDVLFNAAMNLLRRDYATDVDDGADWMIEAMLNEEVTDEDDFSTRMHENVDGARRVFVTVQAQACLLVSNNDGAGMEEGLVDKDSFKDGIPWSQLAYCAYETDIREELDRREKTTYSDLETEDPLEKYCDWETESQPLGDADEGSVDIEVCTIEYKGETYTGRGENRAEALADLRKHYDAS